MLRFTIRRLLLTVPVLLGVATLVFSLLHLVPGDPFNLKVTTPEDLIVARAFLREGH